MSDQERRTDPSVPREATAATPRIAAAMYLRAGTGDEVTARTQAATIRRWAARNGYKIVETFADDDRGGGGQRKPPGLERLFQTVASGTTGFRAILAYDPWRWMGPKEGEREHLEWLFAKLGFELQYCDPEYRERAAERTRLIDTVRRAMAGEFGRKSRGRRRRGRSGEVS